MNYKDNIKEILQERKITRDNDIYLYYYLLRDYLKKDLESYKVYDFLIDLNSGNIPCIDTVKRLRRQLQEEFIELRGKLWNERHFDLQDKTLVDLGYKLF